MQSWQGSVPCNSIAWACSCLPLLVNQSFFTHAGACANMRMRLAVLHAESRRRSKSPITGQNTSLCKVLWHVGCVCCLGLVGTCENVVQRVKRNPVFCLSLLLPRSSSPPRMLAIEQTLLVETCLSYVRPKCSVLQAKSSRHIGEGEATKKGNAQWREKHAGLRESYGIPKSACEGTRTADVIKLAEQITSKKGGDVSRLITDTSQDGTRKAWSEGVVRSLTTSSELHHHGSGRRLAVPELYSLMGFSNPNLSTVSKTQAKELLGESMSVQVVTLCLCSLLLNLGSGGGSRPSSSSQ